MRFWSPRVTITMSLLMLIRVWISVNIERR